MIPRFLKLGLFIYECVRTILLAFTLVFLLPVNSGIPWMALSAPGAIFAIMALFIWIDTDHYKNYLPLYIAGKCIGFFAFLGWSIISGRFTILNWTADVNFISGFIFEAGDLIALGIALFLIKEKQCV